MKMIRTTITLPADQHQKFKQQAFKYQKSLNQVIVERLCEKPEREYSAQSIEKKIADDLRFFQKVGKMGKHIDWVKAIREERERDDA